MSLEFDFQEFMTQNVTIYKKTGTNSHGEDIHSGIGSNYPAMIVRNTKQVRTKDNQVKVSIAQVYLMGDYQIQPDDKIVLPDTKSPVILYIGAWSDEYGPYCQVVYT